VSNVVQFKPKRPLPEPGQNFMQCQCGAEGFVPVVVLEAGAAHVIGLVCEKCEYQLNVEGGRIGIE
jgi:hypothetical protein